jgi:ABC-2 type transport system permease protein
MSANIFKFEFRSRLKSVLTWSLAVTAILFFFFSIYTGFADQAAIINQMLQKFPPALLEAFGLTHVDMSSVLGLYSLAVLFVMLCLAIQAGNYGFGLVSIEENELTADFLLTKPVSRSQVLTSKLLAALACLIITNLVVWVSSFAAIELFKGSHTYDAVILILLLKSLLIFQLFFLCVGLFISLLVKRVRSVTPFSLGLAFGSYVLSALGDVFSEVKLEWLTPFKHLDPSYIIQHGTPNWPMVVLNVTVSLAALILSYWLYLRRDIHAVS